MLLASSRTPRTHGTNFGLDGYYLLRVIPPQYLFDRAPPESPYLYSNCSSYTADLLVAAFVRVSINCQFCGVFFDANTTNATDHMGLALAFNLAPHHQAPILLLAVDLVMNFLGRLAFNMSNLGDPIRFH